MNVYFMFFSNFTLQYFLGGLRHCLDVLEIKLDRTFRRFRLYPMMLTNKRIVMVEPNVDDADLISD